MEMAISYQDYLKQRKSQSVLEFQDEFQDVKDIVKKSLDASDFRKIYESCSYLIKNKKKRSTYRINENQEDFKNILIQDDLKFLTEHYSEWMNEGFSHKINVLHPDKNTAFLFSKDGRCATIHKETLEYINEAERYDSKKPLMDIPKGDKKYSKQDKTTISPDYVSTGGSDGKTGVYYLQKSFNDIVHVMGSGPTLWAFVLEVFGFILHASGDLSMFTGKLAFLKPILKPLGGVSIASAGGLHIWEGIDLLSKNFDKSESLQFEDSEELNESVDIESQEFAESFKDGMLNILSKYGIGIGVTMLGIYGVGYGISKIGIPATNISFLSAIKGGFDTQMTALLSKIGSLKMDKVSDMIKAISAVIRNNPKLKPLVESYGGIKKFLGDILTPKKLEHIYAHKLKDMFSGTDIALKSVDKLKFSTELVGTIFTFFTEILLYSFFGTAVAVVVKWIVDGVTNFVRLIASFKTSIMDFINGIDKIDDKQIVSASTFNPIMGLILKGMSGVTSSLKKGISNSFDSMEKFDFGGLYNPDYDFLDITKEFGDTKTKAIRSEKSITDSKMMQVKQKQVEDFMKKEGNRLEGIGKSLDKEKMKDFNSENFEHLENNNLTFDKFINSKYQNIKEGFFGNFFGTKKTIQQPTQELKDKALIEKWLNDNGITKYTINGNLTVDVYQDINLGRTNLYIIPVKFGRVMGHFGIAGNKLQTLKNCPNYVEKNFDCSSNQLISFDGVPSVIGGSASFSSNKLNNIDMPYNIKVGGNILLDFNLRDFKLEEVMQKFSLTQKAIQTLKSPLGQPFLTKQGTFGWR